MKLKVTAYKESGKYYTSEIFPIKDYPNVFNVDDKTTVGSLRNLQNCFCYGLWQEVKNGDADEYSPIVNGFNGYYFVFEGILLDNEYGFMNYHLDRILRRNQ